MAYGTMAWPFAMNMGAAAQERRCLSDSYCAHEILQRKIKFKIKKKGRCLSGNLVGRAEAISHNLGAQTSTW